MYCSRLWVGKRIIDKEGDTRKTTYMDGILIILFGLAIGSFLNVVIDRAPTEESIFLGRSHCDFCHKALRWYELIPVVSFIALRGKCLRCRKSLSWQYPLVECATGLLFLWLYRLVPFSDSTVVYVLAIGSMALIASSCIVILVADFKYQLIPDTAVIGLLVAGLLRLYLGSPDTSFPVVTGAIGGGIFLFLWWITRGRGMGFGDVKLAAVLGFLIGFPGAVVAFYIAFLTGAMTGVILMIGGKAGMKSKIAFGPFLIIGAIIALVWGMDVLRIFQRYL